MIEDAFKYPTESDNWLMTVLIGGILTIFGFLLLPAFVVYGYLVRVIQRTVDGADEPPVFEDWGELLVDGLQAWIISLVYLLIPLVVAAVTVGGSILAMATGTRAGASAGVAGLFGGLMLTFVLSVLFGYLAVAAIVNFAYERKFGAGFDFGRLREIAFNSEYAVAFLVSLVGFIVAGIVANIPFLGWIVSPFLSFYVGVVAARLWAGGLMDALDLSGGSPETGPDEPVAG